MPDPTPSTDDPAAGADAVGADASVVVPAATAVDAAALAGEPLAEHPLRSGTRRGFVTFMVGRSWNLRGDPNDEANFAHEYGIENDAQLLLEEAIGFHVKPGGGGFAPSLVFQQRLGRNNPGYTFGARAQWDVPLSARYGVYVTPSVLAGYHLAPNAVHDDDSYYYYYYDYGSGSAVRSYYHQGIAQVGLGVKLLLVDRLELAFRPVALSVRWPTDESVDLDWDLVGGFGVTF